MRHLLYAQSASLAQYYLYEHMAYLGWTAPGWVGKWLQQRWHPADEMGRLSCVGWAAWCVFDTWSCVLKLRELGEMEAEVEERWGREGESGSSSSIGAAAAAVAAAGGKPVRQWRRGGAGSVRRRAEALRRIARTRWGLQLNIVRSMLFLLPDVL